MHLITHGFLNFEENSANAGIVIQIDYFGV